MPNWCNNNITISHPDRSKMEALVVAIKEGKFLNHIIPVPASLYITAGRVGDSEHPLQIELEAQEAVNREAHGYTNWYDFCTSRWGTKWDVDPYDPDTVVLDDTNTVSFGFDSAWAPPTGIYETMVEQGYNVQAQYYEPGMGFVGSWEDGCDDYYDIGGMRSTEVRDTIGEFLDDNFGISESMAEYEAEQEDELQEWYEEGVEKTGLTPHKAHE
jgi:hypothetical protein